MMRSITPWVAMGVLSACAPNYHRLYEGPMRPRQSVAILTNGVDQLRIMAIDGKQFKLVGPPHMAFELLPGRHTVTVGYHASWVSGRTLTTVTHRKPWVLELDARPGRRYRVVPRMRTVQLVIAGGRARAVPGKWRPVIVEQ